MKGRKVKVYPYPDMLVARNNPTLTEYDGGIYVSGGTDKSGNALT